MCYSLKLLCFFVFILGALNFASAQNVIPYPDNSLDLAGFVSNGVPPVDEVWSPKEYEKTFQILSKIYEQDKYSLPRFQSKASAALFDRLIAKENFDFLIDSNYTLKDRIVALERYAYIPARLMIFYLEEKVSVERFGAEVLEVMELSVQLTNNAVILIKELKSSIGKQADTNNFNKGFKSILTAHEESVEEIIHIFEKKYLRFEQIALENYAAGIVNLFPKIWKQIDKEKRKPLLKRIKAMAKSHPEKKLKKTMKKLCKKLRRVK